MESTFTSTPQPRPPHQRPASETLRLGPGSRFNNLRAGAVTLRGYENELSTTPTAIDWTQSRLSDLPAPATPLSTYYLRTTSSLRRPQTHPLLAKTRKSSSQIALISHHNLLSPADSPRRPCLGARNTAFNPINNSSLNNPAGPHTPPPPPREHLSVPPRTLSPLPGRHITLSPLRLDANSLAATGPAAPYRTRQSLHRTRWSYPPPPRLRAWPTLSLTRLSPIPTHIPAQHAFYPRPSVRLLLMN